MRRELIIEGQHMDLADKTSVTLEYVSNVLAGGSGKINLSKSYTIKVPKTLNNSRILDDPGTPGHASVGVRRFLSARYYQNGIDLLGPAQAYILKTTADSYELALIWNGLPELQALSESPKTLQDVQGLPVLQWIATGGTTPSYLGETDGAGFAWYDSGLGATAYTAVNTAPHPYISVGSLVDKILSQAGVEFRIFSPRVGDALRGMYLLAAPSHRPNRDMEELSGNASQSLSILTNYDNALFLRLATPLGWDSVFKGGTGNCGATGGVDRIHVSAHFTVAGALQDGAHFKVQGLAQDLTARPVRPSEGEELARVYFDGSGTVDAEIDVDVSAWEYFALNVWGAPGGATVTGDIKVWRVHDTIPITYDNRFPIAENLPAIKQWEFVKACMVLAGAVPVVQDGLLLLMGYDEAFDKANAYDWSDRLADTESIAYTAQNWARENAITYEKDDKVLLSFDPTAVIRVEDATIAASRELFKLPFGASQDTSAVHYKVTTDKDGATVAEDIDIAPRIMLRRTETLGDGTARNVLHFGDVLHGDGLLSARYPELLEVMARPVVLSVRVRLDELDLASLDLRRPVYLRQYGHYYAIIKVQTSDGGCKVELIQIP